MIGLNVVLDGDGAWPDLEAKKAAGQLTWLSGGGGPLPQVVALPRGMESGRTSVALRIDLPSGDVVVMETSLALFLTAADAFRAKYPNG